MKKREREKSGERMTLFVKFEDLFAGASICYFKLRFAFISNLIQPWKAVRQPYISCFHHPSY